MAEKKLHELLAVEAGLRGQSAACTTDLKNTFEKKRTHFTTLVETFHSNVEGVEPKVEKRQEIQTTVSRELKWLSDKLNGAMDVGFQIDIANRTAKADVILADGTVLLADVPATALLQLEKRVTEIHDLVNAIPTLDPTKGYEPDPSVGDGVFKARRVTKDRTEKKFDFVVMVAPTEKHPAQVKELSLDKPIGTLVQDEWSSMLTVSQKGDMIDRVEVLARAIKQARARANESVVDTKVFRVGQKITDFIFTL